MAGQQKCLKDAAGYERLIETWSQVAGDILKWLALPRLRRIDHVCGKWRITKLLVGRWPPATIQEIDASDAGLSFAAGTTGGTRKSQTLQRSGPPPSSVSKDVNGL
jgi:trans-aconitate methyltransferase